jgi:hypothetical protein
VLSLIAWMYNCCPSVLALTTRPRPTVMPSDRTPLGLGTFSRTMWTTWRTRDSSSFWPSWTMISNSPIAVSAIVTSSSAPLRTNSLPRAVSRTSGMAFLESAEVGVTGAQEVEHQVIRRDAQTAFGEFRIHGGKPRKRSAPSIGGRSREDPKQERATDSPLPESGSLARVPRVKKYACVPRNPGYGAWT